jgi:hypothetical protein
MENITPHIASDISYHLTLANQVNVIQHKIKVTYAAIYEIRLTTILDVTLDSTKMYKDHGIVVVVVGDMIMMMMMISYNTKYCSLKN